VAVVELSVGVTECPTSMSHAMTVESVEQKIGLTATKTVFSTARDSVVSAIEREHVGCLLLGNE
jgi:uncharacterized protein (UPF0212 family)